MTTTSGCASCVGLDRQRSLIETRTQRDALSASSVMLAGWPETYEESWKIMHAERRRSDVVNEGHVYEELFNIIHNKPLWPGGTISHRTVEQCEHRGWAKRDSNGRWVPTPAGVDALIEWVRREETKP